jgi:hypothetical protein
MPGSQARYSRAVGFDQTLTGSPKDASAFKVASGDEARFKSWPKTGPQNVPGMVTPGNIDLTKRPLVHNPDGSISSLLSASFGTDDGEVLVPKVSPDGRILSNKEALDRYKKTGEHLGIFKTPEDADKYAEYIHNKQGAFQTWKNGGKYNPSVETTNTPLEDALVKYEDAPASSRKAMEKEIYNQIIRYRKNSKSIDPDDKARIDKRIAQYSNALVKKVTRDPLAGRLPG